MARRPKRPLAAVAAAPALAPEAASSKWRELPEAPEAREAARASVRAEADALLGIANLLAANLPPRRALSELETGMLRPPLEDVVYKYGGNIDPALALAIVAGSIVAMRFAEHRMAKAAEAAKAGGVNPATGEPVKAAA